MERAGATGGEIEAAVKNAMEIPFYSQEAPFEARVAGRVCPVASHHPQVLRRYCESRRRAALQAGSDPAVVCLRACSCSMSFINPCAGQVAACRDAFAQATQYVRERFPDWEAGLFVIQVAACVDLLCRLGKLVLTPIRCAQRLHAVAEAETLLDDDASDAVRCAGDAEGACSVTMATARFGPACCTGAALTSARGLTP